MNKEWMLGAMLSMVLAACSSSGGVTPQPLDKAKPVVEANRITDYRVFVYIEGTNPKAPVRGTKVFDNHTNRLLGVTGDDGIATFEATVGQTIRLVEPGYGMQQSIIVVKARHAISKQDIYVDESTSWRCCT